MSRLRISRERQKDAIRFSRIQAGNPGLREAREKYLWEWSQKTPAEIRTRIAELKEEVRSGARRPEGELKGASWQLAALQTALERVTG